MIPDIAFMVAAYITTRMIQIIAKKDPKEHGAVVASAAITILVTLFALGDVIRRGTDLNKLLDLPEVTQP